MINIKRISYKKNNKVLSKYSLNNVSINKKSLEELGRLLIDFAGQSDTFVFDSQDKRRLIIDDLCSQHLRDNNAKIRTLWGRRQVLKGLINEKIESFGKQEENNLVIKNMLKSLEEANLNSSEEILELELLEKKLVNNFEINNSIQISLNNLIISIMMHPQYLFLINQSIKNFQKTVDFDLKIQSLKKLLNIQTYVEFNL